MMRAVACRVLEDPAWDLAMVLTTFEPEERPTAAQALRHPFLSGRIV